MNPILQALSSLGYMLDTPGSMVRSGIGALTGVDDPWGGNVSGKDLTGWDDPNSYMDDVVGTGVEMVTDPLTYLLNPWSMARLGVNGTNALAKQLVGTLGYQALARGADAANEPARQREVVDNDVVTGPSQVQDLPTPTPVPPSKFYGDSMTVDRMGMPESGMVDQILNQRDADRDLYRFFEEVMLDQPVSVDTRLNELTQGLNRMPAGWKSRPDGGAYRTF